MARWKLLTAHYLNVPANLWEYREVDRRTGRDRRMQIEVPRYLDPRDQQDWTTNWGNRDNQEGEIIVCHRGKGEPSDIEFVGDPTPDMAPLDDEARAISAQFTDRWNHKPETAQVDFSQTLVDKFQAQIAETVNRPPEIPGLSDLVAVLTKMAETGAIQPSARRL